MKTTRQLLPLLALVASLLSLPTAARATAAPAAAPGRLVAPADSDAAWLAQARAAYPLTTCVVSGENLSGAPGETLERIYRHDGQPDRLVRFCCTPCTEDFAKDPERYLARLAAATASPPAHAPH